MSTQIGTLQPNARVAQPRWPVAILALLVVAIVAVIVTSPDTDRPADETSTTVTGAPVSSGIPAIRGKQLGIAVALPEAFAGTVVNTPTELTGGIAFSTAGATTAAPTELSGRFLAERAKQLGAENVTPTGTSGPTNGTGSGGELCDICWKYR